MCWCAISVIKRVGYLMAKKETDMVIKFRATSLRLGVSSAIASTTIAGLLECCPPKRNCMMDVAQSRAVWCDLQAGNRCESVRNNSNSVWSADGSVCSRVPR